MTSKTQVTAVRRAVNAEKRRIVKVGRFVHANPELGFAEVCAAKRIADYLGELGFTVEAPYTGFKTAFRAVLKGRARGPAVAVLAEYDALPGLGHGCGHNLITTAAITAAAGMAGCRKHWRGQFEIIGTPAEEMWAGKSLMVDRGAFNHLSACFMTHPSIKSRSTGPSNASRSFTARFRGKAAHAAAAPQDGINALDAAILFFNSVHAMRQHLREDARIHGIITEGGQACNVIPELAEVRMCVRGQDEVYLEVLRKRVAAAARSAAKAIGATVSIQWEKHWYRAFRPNPALDTVLQETFRQARIPLPKARSGPEGRGSLDMANVSRVVPAAHPFFGILPKSAKGVAIHTREFLRYADTPLAYRRAVQAGTGMALAAQRLLSERQTLTGIKRTHRRA